MILVEFSDALTSDEPFDYIDPSKNNQEIECFCEKNNEGFQVGSTTLKIQGSICHLRKRPDTTFGSKIAITMQIKLNDGFRSFRCFFPGWLNDHNSYISAQAKVVNRGSGYTKKIA